MVEGGWVDVSKSRWIDWVDLTHTTTPSCFVTYHSGLKVGPIAAGPCIQQEHAVSKRHRLFNWKVGI